MSSIKNYFQTQAKRLHPRLWDFVELVRLDKPIGVYLLLWPTAWALWIAGKGEPGWRLSIIFFCGVVLMRSAGCAINDFADRHLDGAVARTRLRPLVTGKIKSYEALLVAAFLVLIAFILVLQVNRLTVYWSMGALLIASIYPFMKRYTHLPQVVLGAAFAWSVPMAFSAQQNHVPETAWLIYIATVFWTIAYDTMYAMADREDDLKAGIKSTAILFGSADKIIIACLQLLTIFSLLLLANKEQFSWIFYISLIVAAGFFIYQQYLISQRNAEKCLLAFKNNHWVGTVIFIGIAGQYFFQSSI
jgi:4-hydroxybenzoate polyprenyltransferase